MGGDADGLGFNHVLPPDLQDRHWRQEMAVSYGHSYLWMTISLQV
jgi:hypothetical protein